MKILSRSLLLSLALVSPLIGQDADPDQGTPSRAVPVEEPEEGADAGEDEEAPPLIPLIPIPESIKEKPLPELPNELKEKLLDEKEIQPTPPPAKVEQSVEPAVEAPETFIKSAAKLQLPFLPKPIHPAPIGWTFRRMEENSRPWTTKLSLADGSTLNLEIRPFRLAVPSREEGAFTIVEPGFDPKQAYRQGKTLGALLTRYDLELEKTEAELDTLIKELDELLSSLPSQP